jgi:hypothetical protein
MNSPPPKPEVILTNFFAEPTVVLVPITSRVHIGEEEEQEQLKFSNNFILKT